jgi:hypothetical protein
MAEGAKLQFQPDDAHIVGVGSGSSATILGYNPATGQLNYQTNEAGTVTSVSSGTGINITGTASDPIVNLSTLGVPQTATYPTLLKYNEFGQLTSHTDGSQPVTGISAGVGIDVSGDLTNYTINNDGVLSVSANGGIEADTLNGQVALTLETLGSEGTYYYPSELTVDNKGRVVAGSSGLAPITSLVAGLGLDVSGNQISMEQAVYNVIYKTL